MIQNNPHKPPASYAVHARHPELSNQTLEILNELLERPLSKFSNMQGEE